MLGSLKPPEAAFVWRLSQVKSCAGG